MKVQLGKNEFIELYKYDSITIIDDSGNKWKVNQNDTSGNGLKICDLDGNIFVKPSASNSIHLFSTSTMSLINL